jgi:protein tyrosine/serine phosphatase
MAMPDHPALVGVHNFRDLGGYPTVSGRSTRWGRLFRSDALHELTCDDVSVIRRLGLVTIIDLRTASEAEWFGRGLMESEPVRYVNTSIHKDGVVEERVASMTAAGNLTERYISYLEEGGEAFVRAIRELAVEANYPAVFHCFFGKDRTGVFAALILDCLGVSHDAIVQDYVRSAAGTDRILAHLRDDPVYRETINRTDPVLLSAIPASMEGFLRELHQRYGGADAWFRQAGVQSRHLDALSELLLA